MTNLRLRETQQLGNARDTPGAPGTSPTLLFGPPDNPRTQVSQPHLVNEKSEVWLLAPGVTVDAWLSHHSKPDTHPLLSTFSSVTEGLSLRESL